MKFPGNGVAPVEARIIVGVGESIPSAAGWYVVCNGRVVLEADRSDRTGWGAIEEERGELLVPRFHNQYARFRGLAFFESSDSSRVPWNTMKTDVDQSSPIWQKTYERMLEMMRPVIGFLNELDRDIDENTRDRSPMNQLLSNASHAEGDQLRQKQSFSAPERSQLRPLGPRMITIQYSKPYSDVAYLQDALRVYSAKAVGEKTLDLTLQKQKGE